MTAAACSLKDPPVHYGYFQLFRQSALISAPPFLLAICVADGKAICAAFFKELQLHRRSLKPLMVTSAAESCLHAAISMSQSSRPGQILCRLRPHAQGLRPRAEFKLRRQQQQQKERKGKSASPGFFCVCPRVQ